MRLGLCAVLALTLATDPAVAREYCFDSEKGSDDSPGTRSAAMRSLGKLRRLSLKPGDVVLFKRGSVFRGAFDFRGNGAKGKPIVLTAYGKGPKPEFLGSARFTGWRKVRGEVYERKILKRPIYGRWGVRSVFEYEPGKAPVRLMRSKDGALRARGRFFHDKGSSTLRVRISDGASPDGRTIEVPVIQEFFWWQGRSWIVVENLAFLFANRGHFIFDGCKDITFRNCASMFVGGHINFWVRGGSERIKALNCLFYENCNNAVYFSDGATQCVASGCVAVKGDYNNGMTCHCLGGRGKTGKRTGITGDHNIIENNVIGLFPEESIDITSGDYHIIRGNICYGNHNPGIVLGHDSDHILIQNNICFANGRAGIQIGGSEKEGARGHNRVIQNLVFDNGRSGLQIRGKHTILYNNTVVNSRYRAAIRINAQGYGSEFKNNLIVTLSPTIRSPSMSFTRGDPKTFGVKMSHNLFYHVAMPDGRLFSTKGGRFTLEQFAAKYGVGRGSLSARPQFRSDRYCYYLKGFKFKVVHRGVQVGIEPGTDVRYYFLKPGGPGVDAGVDVGLPFKGKAPDLGWKEVGDESQAPKYPVVLLDGKDDEPGLLYLWGKRPNPPPFRERAE